MTSKNSFWKLSIWNMKKRSWVAAVCFCVWFFALPIYTYLTAYAYAHDIKMYGATQEYLRDMIWAIWQTDFYSVLHIVITIALAIIMPIQAFGWLNKRQKVDMYKSVPVRECTRFIYTHLNSLLIFAVPFLFNLILANIVTAALGVFDSLYIMASVKIFIICVLMYIAVYMLVLIAQLLTGNVVLAFFGGCFLLLVEPVCRLICFMYQTYFYETMYRGYSTQISSSLMHSVTSPVATGICSFLSYRNEVFSNQSTSYVYYRLGMGVVNNDLQFAFTMILQAIVYGVIAYYLYKRRAAQTGGKNILFVKTIPIIKLAIIFVISFGVGMLACSTGVGMDMEVTYGFVGIVLSAVVLHIVLSAIIEGDLNEAMKKVIKSLPISILGCAMACGLFSVYAFDLLHYDTYLPKEKELESFAFIRANDTSASMDIVRSYPEVMGVDRMQITDENAKKVLLSVLKDAMERNEYNFSENIPEYVETSAKEALGLDTDLIYEDGGLLETVSVAYNLKNGKRIYRSYRLKHTDARKIYMAMYDLPEYKAVYNPLADGRMLDFIKDKRYKKEAIYIPYGFEYITQGNGTTHLTQDALEKLCAAAKDDINERHYEDIVASAPIARFVLGVDAQVDDNGNFHNYDTYKGGFFIVVYESDKRMMQVIKEEGLCQDIDIPMEEIREIEVYYTENEYEPNLAKQRKYTISLDDIKNGDNEEKELVESLLAAAVPAGACIDAIDTEMLLKSQYFIIIKPYKGDEEQYSLYIKNFPPKWKEVMENADINDNWMGKFRYNY